MTILVTGGSGSGKSAFAEGLVPRLEAHGRIYLATMEAADGESRRRVMRHRAQREGLGMRTLERARDMDGAEIPQGSLVLLEDLPNWLAGEMFGGGDPQGMPQALRRHDNGDLRMRHGIKKFHRHCLREPCRAGNFRAQRVHVFKQDAPAAADERFQLSQRAIPVGGIELQIFRLFYPVEF